MFLWLVAHGSNETISLTTASLWAVWAARNQKTFQGTTPDLPSIVAKFVKLVSDYSVYAARVFKAPHQAP